MNPEILKEFSRLSFYSVIKELSFDRFVIKVYRCCSRDSLL